MLVFVIVVKSLFRDAHFSVDHFINGFLRDFAAFAIGIGNGAFDFSVAVEFDDALFLAVLVVFALGRHTPVFVIAGFVFLPVFVIRVFARTARHFMTVEFLFGNDAPPFVIGIFCFARKLIGTAIFPTGGNVPFFVAADIGGTEKVFFDLDFFLALSGLPAFERIRRPAVFQNGIVRLNVLDFREFLRLADIDGRFRIQKRIVFDVVNFCELFSHRTFSCQKGLKIRLFLI